MSVLETGDLNLPNQIIDPWLGKVRAGSAVATLSSAIPMKFGKGQAFVFDIGEAEYVGEGANKGPSDITTTIQTVDPFKFHKTVRMTDEVLWADEDYQLEVVEQILSQIQPALSRALDYGVFHGINPATGAAVTAMSTKLSDTTNSVTAGAGDAPYVALDAAGLLVLEGANVPSGVALDPSYAAAFAGFRTDAGVKLYPELRLATDAGTIDGHGAAVSRTVSASGVIDPATGIKAFVGDFDAIRWGIQKQIGLEVIRYGDPDGQGDLQRNNQVAFRAEVVYGWGIADLDAFAKITETAD